MARNHRNTFISVKIEGALLSPDLLERIVIAPEEVEGLTPSDYHLVGNERINEVINRSWNRLTAIWQSFQEVKQNLSEGDWATGMTRERWLLPLFQELGYGRLIPSKSVEVNGKGYPISHTWQNSPIHLLGYRVSLDRRTPGVAGAAAMSPHSLVQEYLNRSDDHLWGIVSNGLILRVLRDNASISHQQYIEFDLEGIMEGELYSDFVLFWLLCHQSRFEAENPADCWLERWGQTVQEEGSRVLERLRDGVKDAIITLGQGFLEHPFNEKLREKLQTGRLDRQEFFRQILRLVYRMIFLCTAEDRNLLFAPGTSEQVRLRYEKYYSMRRLRDLAEKRRGSEHYDLYQQLKLVMARLGETDGAPALGISALGSYLWSERALPDLKASDIRNRELLSAIRLLTLHQSRNRRIRIDFRHLGAEEMGSVYESLLELHPELHVEARNFELKEAAGSERKTTGSYYTPTSLINCLLDSALDPILEEAAQQPNPEDAILSLKICDPACGSGQFLVGAARRVAYRLAAIRCGEDEPTPEYYRPALRQVFARCIYGVDINEMAVELCKVNLWLESLEPGMPLCFLDHHIKCGNSLLGTTPALMEKGIPDAAFTAIEGDNRKDVSALKRQNREEREGQMGLFGVIITSEMQLMGHYLQQIDGMLEEDLKEQAEKEKRYYNLVESANYRHQVLCADAWCAAFVWIKDYKKIPVGLTQEVLNTIKQNPEAIDPRVIEEIERLARQYQFFHWHLAFPDVFQIPEQGQKAGNVDHGWSGGFHVVLGNPPWERIKLQEKEWFSGVVPEIAQAPNAVARRRMIAELAAESPGIYLAFTEDRRQAEGESHLSRNSGYFPLCGRGDINTYAIFAELMKNMMSPRGRVGFVVPSGIATDDTTKFFFQEIMEKRLLSSLYDFENRQGIFMGVHRSYKFCLLTLTGQNRPAQKGTEFIFFAYRVEDLDDKERRFTLTAEDIELLKPNTRTCPVFRSCRDAELTLSIYRRVPVLIMEGTPEVNQWGISFLRMFDMSNDSHLFRTRQQLEDEGYKVQNNIFICEGERYIQLFEGRLGHQFNHRFACQPNGNLREISRNELIDPYLWNETQYLVPASEVERRIGEKSLNSRNAFLGHRRVARNTDERTSISCIFPYGGASYGWILSLGPQAGQLLLLCGAYNSFCFDYLLRNSLSQPSIPQGIFKQIPLPSPSDTYQNSDFLIKRGLELTYTSWDLAPFAQDCGYNGPPFRWDEERRFHIRCELDAAYFHLYGIVHDDVDYIMETFPIIKRKDEANHGFYRTKETILAIYDQMQTAMDCGQPYQTLLDPPPGPPEVWPPSPCTPWPEHIHEGK